MSEWRALAKRVLGDVPLTAELYQRWKPNGTVPTGGYPLDRLGERLPGWVEAARAARGLSPRQAPRRILVFAYLQWWLEHAAALALLLWAEGHDVELATLPFRRWQEPMTRFDARRQSAYLQHALRGLAAAMPIHDLSQGRRQPIPGELEISLRRQCLLDVQYTLQREDVDIEGDRRARDLFGLRRQRNKQAAGGALALLGRGPWDTVIIPNGSILEFGALYRTCRYLDLPVVTYEFGEQRQRMWLAQNAEVMRLPTNDLWQARGDLPLTEDEMRRIEALYQARRGGRAWSHFARQWQRSESQGAQKARQKLELDAGKPMVLLCTNVVGDSLALDRQVFTGGMADWLARTVQHFSDRPEAQLVVRVHPGELLGAGHPSVDIVGDALPQLSPHVRVIPPDSEVNTYDLIELAHVGLVYTTTVGLEMAMLGVPVVAAGATHFRGKGFTQDPQTFEAYLEAIDDRLRQPLGGSLPKEQVELAWRYAYRFFFEYPFAFPWHLLGFWEDLDARPLEATVQPDARNQYERALAALAGETVRWDERQSAPVRAEVGS